MPRYLVNWRYSAYRDGVTYGPYAEGDTVELSEADAAWIDRDSPGVLAAEKQAEREAKPTANRQHKGGRNRAGA